MSGRNDVTSDKVNFIPDIRQILLKKHYFKSLPSNLKTNKQDVCYFTFLADRVRGGLYFL